jgi:perosamine synthetase
MVQRAGAQRGVGRLSFSLQPRLRLDIGWAELISAFAPARGDWRAALKALWPRPSLACLSARTAFDVILQTLDVRQGDEIVMSAVNIASMAEVAQAHGLKIVPVDIDLATLAPSPDAVRAAMSPRTRLVLIAQLFGARTPLAAYESVRANGALLVEDCAQAWGGGFTGSAEADVSLFSFGPIKRRTALGGALASFRDEALAERCAAIEARYDPMPESWFVKRVGKYCALKAATAPLLYRAIHAAVQLATGDAEKAIGAAARGFPAGELIKRLRRRPPQRMLKLLHRRLADLGPRS